MDMFMEHLYVSIGINRNKSGSLYTYIYIYLEVLTVPYGYIYIFIYICMVYVPPIDRSRGLASERMVVVVTQIQRLPPTRHVACGAGCGAGCGANYPLVN